MIDIQIDTSRLEAKLRLATLRISESVEVGTAQGMADMANRIDDFMFVPLAFESQTDQRGNETTSSLAVNLDLKQKPQRQFVRRTKFNRSRSRLPRYGQKKPRTWPNYVRTLSEQSTKAVSVAAIALQLRRKMR
jgi:hypothetical protein